jgi:hypothetical protein
VVDVHGNSPADWQRYAKPLLKMAHQGSTLILNNLRLGRIPEWQAETGVEWFLDQLPQHWRVAIYENVVPGIAVVKNLKDRQFGKRVLTYYDESVQFLRFIKQLWGTSNLSSIIRMSVQLTLLTQSDFFDIDYYLQNNPDVKASVMNPALHFLLHGGFEGRKPSVWFNTVYYLQVNADVAVCGINPLVHFLKYGRNEGRKTTDTVQ